LRTLMGWECQDCRDLKPSNRPVRTRMPGGVAGVPPTGGPLCRFQDLQLETPFNPRPKVIGKVASQANRSSESSAQSLQPFKYGVFLSRTFNCPIE